ncbi:tRNA preQ1(34) S-adenosylmethionine ribosyltransferase-isomerase QueA [Bosea sp. BH3]|uniref:tRNA preQ1(34) S-adenosylmethionine ribosyltransferase-isomerase QueA n=1 Tax=Bosea sp. BH3 TaxID=2871701 RepID=UPI0021CB963A|nr:tRNA preQ1(34) S-adenosylmethionine ribosyltransferase-isomerase QueA [Bosea sp. BH3]MCU4180285.1 tRNA preQ1(34) S-adenosylmethionine ribosyltransferase-isomerase QueA [Bosea sp. BH3]
MNVDLFDFDLPEDRIALRPASPRDAARLLVVRPDAAEPLADAHVRDLVSLLQPGDALVLNDTRVIPSRLRGRRYRGADSARIEIMLHKRESEDRWLAFARPAKKLAVGETVVFDAEGASNACELGRLQAEVLAKSEGGEVELQFSLTSAYLDEAIARLGELPLPPYIAGKRPADSADATDYQTAYARQDGAVAAPTAGLHFTPELFAALEARGVSRHFVTLHVGAGTFLPVKAENTDDHRMHAEWGTVTAETAGALNALKARGGRIVCVGTTSLRLIESAASEDGTIQPFSGDTAIFITPGYRFRAVDMLMTNFHLPRSTLFMLVSAFCGLDVMKRAYAHAIAAKYRFYSYGDGSLLYRASTPSLRA